MILGSFYLVWNLFPNIYAALKPKGSICFLVWWADTAFWLHTAVKERSRTRYGVESKPVSYILIKPEGDFTDGISAQNGRQVNIFLSLHTSVWQRRMADLNSHWVCLWFWSRSAAAIHEVMRWRAYLVKIIKYNDVYNFLSDQNEKLRAQSNESAAPFLPEVVLWKLLWSTFSHIVASKPKGHMNGGYIKF